MRERDTIPPHLLYRPDEASAWHSTNGGRISHMESLSKQAEKDVSAEASGHACFSPPLALARYDLGEDLRHYIGDNDGSAESKKNDPVGERGGSACLSVCPTGVAETD
ncbi:hypothetical protein ECG_01981 [Echinococcus granulosus]|nr:hypothetical protein ECG_01981 [Echinococcus granulosus]